jgi:hypothetical protein
MAVMTSRTPWRDPLRCIVPPYLLQQLARTAPHDGHRWERLLQIDGALRLRRATAPVTSLLPRATTGPAWVVHTADNGSELPGRVVRSAGDPASGDQAVDEAADGVAATLSMFGEVYARDSYDGAGAVVSSTVHYERDYDNAFWDGTQLVLGDGDGRVFGRFTRAVDVLAHELTHAVTEHTAGLVYQGQSGALNESVSDVFGSCLKQRVLGQGAREADWLIGAGLFVPGIHARGLRDMAAPGTAYDDPALGRDPQPAHLDDYVDTADDNGGVHLNSGIPNRAFQLAATAIGGSSAEGAGAIWYAALTGGLDPRADFAAFAAATVAAAGEHAEAVTTAWTTVGVTPRSPGSAPVVRDPATSGAKSGAVTVRRTGGFAGRTHAGSVDLAGTDDRAAEVRSLVERVDLRTVRSGLPRPDMYVYDFDLCGDRAAVPEQHLTPDLRRIADLLLGDGTDRS